MEELDHGWQLIEGSVPILLVAAHNFDQGRNGKIKLADLNTGDLVRGWCEQFRLWGIITTRKQLDPNWYKYSPFREKVKELIKNKNINLIIDIHGNKLGNKEPIELRANKYFATKYRDMKIKDFSDDMQLTLGEELELPLIQIEIREDGRVPTVDPIKYVEINKILINLLTKLINEH